MKKSTPIYRITPNEFYTNRYNLFSKIKEEIDRWWVEDQLPNLKDDFAFEALETQNLNVKTLGKISLPVQDLLVIDKNNQNIDLNAEVIIELELKLKTGIVK